MARKSNFRLFISLLFVLGLLALVYWLINSNIISMLSGDSGDEVELGKGYQYKFAYIGTGDMSNIISLNKGSSMFEFYHEGKGDFYADVKRSDGRLLKVLAQTKGNYQGKMEVEVPETDAYTINIKTTGKWGLDFK